MKWIFCYVVFGFCLIAEGCSNKQMVELWMINQIEDCEESNIHYRIIELVENNNRIKFEKVILPMLSEGISNSKNYELLWPEETTRRISVQVKGRYSSKRNELSYGCLDADGFMIDTIISVEDVTEELDFPINNN